MIYIALYLLLFLALAGWGRSIAIGVQRPDDFQTSNPNSEPHE